VQKLIAPVYRKFLTLCVAFLKADTDFMRPDYPHKIFTDKRINYCLLIESLAIDHRSAAI